VTFPYASPLPADDEGFNWVTFEAITTAASALATAIIVGFTFYPMR
jgi:hypothetical protein